MSETEKDPTIDEVRGLAAVWAGPGLAAIGGRVARALLRQYGVVAEIVQWLRTEAATRDALAQPPTGIGDVDDGSHDDAISAGTLSHAADHIAATWGRTTIPGSVSWRTSTSSQHDASHHLDEDGMCYECTLEARADVIRKQLAELRTLRASVSQDEDSETHLAMLVSCVHDALWHPNHRGEDVAQMANRVKAELAALRAKLVEAERDRDAFDVARMDIIDKSEAYRAKCAALVEAVGDAAAFWPGTGWPGKAQPKCSMCLTYDCELAKCRGPAIRAALAALAKEG